MFIVCQLSSKASKKQARALSDINVALPFSEVGVDVGKFPVCPFFCQSSPDWILENVGDDPPKFFVVADVVVITFMLPEFAAEVQRQVAGTGGSAFEQTQCFREGVLSTHAAMRCCFGDKRFDE